MNTNHAHHPLCCFVSVSVCDGDEFEYALVRDLMRDYDPRIRPSQNASEALNVTFGLALAQIIDVVSHYSHRLHYILHSIIYLFPE